MLKHFIISVLSLVLYSTAGLANITVGTVYFYPPFVFSPNQGFDIDLIRTICNRINEQCTIIPMNYNELFTALTENKIDIAIGGLSISDAALEGNYIFSLPYHLSHGQFFALASNGFNAIIDLDKKRIGVLKGYKQQGIFYTFLMITFPKMQIQLYEDVEDIIAALTNKEIDGAFLHESAALYWQENGGDGVFQLVGKAFPLGNGIGVMSIPKNSVLIQKINQQLNFMEQDSTYLNLYKTYFGDNND